MDSKLPDGFVSLQKAYTLEGQFVNIMGVVVDYLPITQSRGTDYTCTCVIHDPSWVNASSVEPGIRVRMFQQLESSLPRVHGVGDIVVFRNMKKDTRFGLIGLSNRSTEAIVFPADSIPVPELKDAIAGRRQLLSHQASPQGCRPPTLAEQLYAIALHALEPPGASPLFPSSYPSASASTTRASQASKAIPFIKNNKFALIKDIGPKQYVDLVGEVVKFYPGMGEIDIYITDYTENRLLYLYQTPEELSKGDGRDGDVYNYTSNQPMKKWQGPFGQMTLPVRLWYPHSDWARGNIQEGDFVFLRNVHMKYSQNEKLEGALHQDLKFPDQVDVRKLAANDGRIGEIKKRKADYERRHGASSGGGARKMPLSKKEKKKAQKAKLEEKKASINELEVTKIKAPIKNQYVRCAHPDTRISSISSIIENPYLENKAPNGIETKLPFVNAKYRARVRVVDFWPPKLEDFSRSLNDTAYNDTICDTNDDESHQSDPQVTKSWEWAFCLLVEDATTPSSTKEPQARLNLLVAQDDAVHLLKMDATDLRKDSQSLVKLKEKLFVLWGNLQELKSSGAALPPASSADKGLSSQPFECCIQEYGVPTPVVDGSESDDADTKWQRMHRMFQTTMI
ncbi:hypothetical protein AOQ84DRAFT_226728 [Glonium stellatum]|uniref:Protection of telomeres protein 1 n=1 Tax=Glonium stellatum TaxID=574774 RepID=A0A8E2ES93_9PEZI|nr:hypothetical protein AOQ84DRAFT_226728 [Glonium stellatum]